MSRLYNLDRHLGVPGFLALTLVLFTAFSTPASAQLTDRQWEWGFSVGSADLDSSVENLDLDLRVDFRGGYFVTPNFQLEAQLMRADAILDARLLALTLNAVYNFQPDERIVPYVFVGAGYSNFEDINFLDAIEDVDEDAGAFQAGLGSRFFFKEGGNMAFRLELSSLWIDTDILESDRHISLTAGLSWAIGG